MIEVTRLTTWQENFIAKWDEFARLRFSKYVPEHPNRIRNKEKGYSTARSIESLSGQVLDGMVVSGMEDAEARSFWQGMTETGLKKL